MAWIWIHISSVEILVNCQKPQAACGPCLINCHFFTGMYKIRCRSCSSRPAETPTVMLRTRMPTTTTTTTVIAGAGHEAEKLMDQGIAEQKCVGVMRRASATSKKQRIVAMTMPMPHAILLLIAVLLAVLLEVAEGRRNKRPDSQ